MSGSYPRRLARSRDGSDKALRSRALTRSLDNVTIATPMRSATHTERQVPQAPVEPEANEPTLAWPESDPRWLLLPASDSEAERPDPAEAIEAFNRMLGERQRESTTEVDARR